jgi:hypothetical protein
MINPLCRLCRLGGLVAQAAVGSANIAKRATFTPENFDKKPEADRRLPVPIDCLPMMRKCTQ